MSEPCADGLKLVIVRPASVQWWINTSDQMPSDIHPRKSGG